MPLATPGGPVMVTDDFRCLAADEIGKQRIAERR